MPEDNRRRLTIVGGFLGSGKTTWLRHQLHCGTFGKAIVIVNEAAETSVDDVLLQQAAQVEVVAGGCACCDALPELLALLRRLADERTRTGDDGGKPAQIVLETSGLADPGPIIDAIRADPMLAFHVVVSEIVVTVDGLYGLRHLKEEPLGRRQVELADRLVIAKADAAEPETLRKLAATLAAVNPGAKISGAAKGEPVALPDFTGVSPEPLADPQWVAGEIKAQRIELGEDIDWPAFSVWLSALLHARGDDILRVKGVVDTPAGRLLLQSVRKTMQSPEILPPRDKFETGEDNSIVFIGRGFTASQLERSLRHFAGGRKRADNQEADR
jgi:G3E family GTPase